MKKFIFMMIAMLTLAISANAQSQSNYAGSSKFSDNISVTFQGGVLTTLNDFYAGHTAMAPIAVLGVDKYINPWLGVGIEGRTLIGTGTINEARFNSHTAFDAVNVSGYVKFNLANIFSYTGSRKFFEPVVYTGLGWGHYTCGCEPNTDIYLTHTTATHNYVTYRAGAELNFNLGKTRAWGIVVNPSVVWGDICNGRLAKYDGNFEVTAGVVYHFKTSNGTNSIAKAKLYNQAEIDALNGKIGALQRALAEKPKVVTNYVEKPVTKNVDNSYTVLFQKGKSNVGDISSIVSALKSNNNHITIVGGTSPEGSEKLNKNLGIARAKAVKDALVKAGISADRITITDDYSSQRRATIIVDK